MNRYATDPDISSLLKNIDVYVIPMVNPDGAMFDIDGRRYRWWRKNRRNNSDNSFGVDLNRNYGFGWGTELSFRLLQIFTRAHQHFQSQKHKVLEIFFLSHRNITVALSLHTF